MSTYWGYRCLDCGPDADSPTWLNHGEEQLRAFYDLRREFAALVDGIDSSGLWIWDIWVGYTSSIYDDPYPHRWLHDHATCAIVLHNEYGDTATLAREYTNNGGC